jgi:hypothetical protein
LQRIYLEAVPAEVGKSSRVGWTRAGVVFVVAGNGAVAAKLRQLAPRILERFRRQGHEFNAMRVEVQVEIKSQSPRHIGAKALSDKALASIRQAACKQPDETLRQLLLRLARNRGNR